MYKSIVDRQARQEQLIEINIDDMLKAIGRPSRPVWRLLFRPTAARFAQQVMQFDDTVGREGLAAGSRAMLNTMQATVHTHNIANAQHDAPTVYLANHPGMTDTIALFATLPRTDIKIIAAHNRFLACLPHVSQQLIPVDLEGGANFGAVRQAVRHLKQGGAVVTFPAGKIEPDPAVAHGAIQSLASWSDSIDVFGRLVPECVVVPVLIAGVVSPRAYHNRLVRLRKKTADQAWTAAILQIAVSFLRPVDVHLFYGKPIMAKRPAALVRDRMREMIMVNYRSR